MKRCLKEGGEQRGRKRVLVVEEDQLDVSEWTLPGPSVGEVTDEGVGASCQPPFALMPCGLYIWLAVSPSLYPPV